ncbi:TetR/AcrR family transcriptional regulator [Mycobacterium sp. 21AC1]|uniref:TetR/AcrR family transcriptional regulator n=1 Tax=[Mycobacterium] appelbergii TaxID=2939269 RepID=UPI00293952AE|nr:TetR family transcriptional regulator [Mycobacterium sp. 21AC1]MDV3123797.1 TetR/AcrR family transcriptional regulator [Mycobacterium sp. 21AC1]
MPKVDQSYLDARRQQIVDAARTRFAGQGFAGTSLADIVTESGLSNGAIYRYFTSKDEIVTAICDQAGQAFPDELTATAIHEFLERTRVLAREEGHARLVAQIYAEAAISPRLATLVQSQLTALRDSVAALLPGRQQAEADRIAEAFVAVCVGYSQQLAVRGDLDPAPFVAALMAVIDP